MLNKRATYGDDWGVPSAEHPAGPCLNRSAPGVEDGSYLEKSWVNDLMALPGAIMNAAGYTPNGTEDTATASQVFDALVNGRWSVIANYTVGTIVTASNGKQYYCNKDSGRDSAPVDPVSDTLDNWREYPYKKISTSSGIAFLRFDGTAEMVGESVGSGIRTVTFPHSFSSSPTVVLTSNNACYATEESRSNTSVVVSARRGGSESSVGPSDFSSTISWNAKGSWV